MDKNNLNENKKEYLYVNELFNNDFFKKLGVFIFDKNFDDFYEKEIEFKNNYPKNVIYNFWLEEEYLDKEIDTNFCFPLSFDTLMEMYQNDHTCRYNISKRLFFIKYLIQIIFNKENNYFENNLFSINLNKQILFNFYLTNIEQTLYNSKINDLFISNLEKNKYFYLEGKNKFNIINARNILLSVFDCIELYLQTLYKNITKDTQNIISTYDLETKWLLSQKPNLSKNDNYYLNEVKKQILKERNIRFEKTRGREKREIIGYFPYSPKELEIYIQKIINEFNQHTFVKKRLRELKFEYASKKDFDLANKDIKDYFYNLDISASIEVQALAENYLYLKEKYGIVNLKEAIIYTLLDISSDLGLYKNSKDESENILEKIRKDFKRRRIDNSFKKSSVLFSLYDDKKFKKLYKKLFN